MKFMRYYLISLLLLAGLTGQSYAAADLCTSAVISQTDASNGSGTMPSWSGSAAPSTIDDAGRALQGAVARDYAWRNFTVTSAGSSTAYTLTYAVAPIAYCPGQVFSFILDEANGASPTFNVNTLGAVTAKKLVAGVLTDIAAGDWLANDRISLAYNATGPVLVWVNQGNPNVFNSTTEQLTGTNATKASTADSVAALWEAGSDITDGAAITIGEGGYFNLITSTTAITSFSVTTDKAGRTFRVRFDTARTLTHNGTSLIIPGAANITTAQGDIAFIRSLGSGNVVVENYTRANGLPLYAEFQIAFSTTTSGTTHSVTSIPSYCRELYIELAGISFTASATLALAVSEDNGSSYGTARAISVASGSAGGVINGTIRVGNLKNGGSLPTAFGVTAIAATATATQLATMMADGGGGSGTMDAIQFSGGTFDAGNIRTFCVSAGG